MISINTQSSIKITGNKIIYFDPYQIKEELHDADYIFITHDHYDHYDIDSINKIKNDNTKFIIPEVIDIDGLKVLPNKEYKIDDIYFKTIPSYNIDKSFHPKDRNYVGYIINIENVTYYIAGDTDITEENKKVKCDIALVPIGGTYTMDYKEAANLINEIKPTLAIPTHYGSIVGSKEDGEKFRELLNEKIKCDLLI
ncbi:MAG: MBL fold metallo-hydrolase [Bacilli bacterium]|nr:MBL fold metallo-hydrolase [Bacilli bacterium]MBO6195726.1 MBL fold metallo-hydrolase [Bacilli bacterium]